jgi:hypothetical protein
MLVLVLVRVVYFVCPRLDFKFYATVSQTRCCHRHCHRRSRSTLLATLSMSLPVRPPSDLYPGLRQDF